MYMTQWRKTKNLERKKGHNIWAKIARESWGGGIDRKSQELRPSKLTPPIKESPILRVQLPLVAEEMGGRGPVSLWTWDRRGGYG